MGIDIKELNFWEEKTNRFLIADTLNMCFAFEFKAKIKTDSVEDVFEIFGASDFEKDGKLERKGKNIHTGKEENFNINSIKSVAKEETKYNYQAIEKNSIL